MIEDKCSLGFDIKSKHWSTRSSLIMIGFCVILLNAKNCSSIVVEGFRKQVADFEGIRMIKVVPKSEISLW